MRKTKLFFQVFISLILVPIFSIAQGSIGTHIEEVILKGNWEEVIRILEKDDSKADDPVARLIMGHACLATNRNNASMLLFLSAKKEDDLKVWSRWTESLLLHNPNNPFALYLSADTKARVGDLKEAKERFTQALQIKYDFALAYNARGVVHVLTNEWGNAQVDFYLATKLAPEFADAYANLGALGVIQEASFGVGTEALEAFNQAITINPEFALAYNGRGCLYFGNGEFEKAVEDFRTASSLNPSLGMSEINQGFTFAHISPIIALGSMEERPGTTLEFRQQYKKILDKQNQELLKILPPQEDRGFWKNIDALPMLSQDQLYSFAKEYGLQKVQIGASLKTQQFKDQVAKDCQMKLPLSDKINLSNHLSSLAFSYLDMDKSANRWESLLSKTTDHIGLQNMFVGITPHTSYSKLAIQAAHLQIINKKLNFLNETYTPLQILAASIEVFNKSVKLLEGIEGAKILPEYIEIPSSFLPAIIKDIDEGTRNPLVSHTLEQAGEFGLNKMPLIVNHLKHIGKLPPSFKIPPTTFGIDKFVAGGASHLGYKTMNIEVITQYLDGIAAMTAAIAGMCIAGPKGAMIGEAAVDLGGPILRGLTWPLFRWTGEKIANKRIRQDLLEAWRTAQERRSYDGLPLQGFSEMYSPSYLKQVGFDSKTVAELNRYADFVNNIMNRQPSSKIPAYYTSVDRPLPEIGALASTVDKGIKPEGSLPRTALIVSQDPFRTNLLQSELNKYGFQARVVPPTNDPQRVARDTGADVILGVKSEKYYDPTDIARKTPPPFPPPDRGGAAVPSWDWGTPFIPTYPKGGPGGISTEELAQSFVDKGNWPVMTNFTLLYTPGLDIKKPDHKEKEKKR
ncbi:TPA: hypothetical protein DCX15_00895 [bacterium]|nr:hypothetical protein [bacterium]